MLRHLGAHKDCGEICKIKAAVSISGAFELAATAIDLKTETFGFYDNFMLTRIRQHFDERKFSCQVNGLDYHDEKAKQKTSCFDFDASVRSKFFGYNGGHELYRAISCDAFIPEIKTPVFAMTSRDDPITTYKNVPVGDIRRNPNFLLAVLPMGGHVDFFTQKINPENG